MDINKNVIGLPLRSSYDINTEKTHPKKLGDQEENVLSKFDLTGVPFGKDFSYEYDPADKDN